jgi:hypothetical protein
MEKKDITSRTEKNHNENIEHQKELTELEDVSHKHEGGFDKNKLDPSDMRNTKNQNN